MKNKIKPIKLTKLDKVIYVYESIIQQGFESGRSVPIKIIVKKFIKDPFFKISEKEVNWAISKLEKTGVILSFKKGYVERLNHG